MVHLEQAKLTALATPASAQEALSEQGKHVHKDTHWDLARIKRWRWRDKFGMGALTGSDRFVARKYPQVDEERFKGSAA